MGKLLSVSTRATAAPTLEDTVETTLCTTPATAPVMTAAFAEKPEATLLAMFPPAVVPVEPNTELTEESPSPTAHSRPPEKAAAFPSTPPEKAAPEALPEREKAPAAPDRDPVSFATNPEPAVLPAAPQNALPNLEPVDAPDPDSELSTFEAKPSMDGITFTLTDPTFAATLPPYSSTPSAAAISSLAASAESLRRSFLARSPGDMIRCGALTRFLASSVNP